MGLWAGLIRQLFSLIGMIVGLLLAGAYGDALAEKCTFFDPNTAHIFAFVVIFLGAIIVASIIGSIIRMALKNTPFGIIDKIGGAVLGLLSGAIFIGAILAMYLKYVGQPDVITSSPVAAFLVDKFGIVLGLLPAQFDSIRSYF
jgi:membrane protein required for colicin V production